MFAIQSFLSATILFVCIHESVGQRHEGLLFKQLLTDYDVRERPARQIQESVEVQFAAALQKIVLLNQKTQIMTITFWIREYWYDYRLEWDPDDWNGTESVLLPYKDHWRPDITLYNNADDEVKPVLEDLFSDIEYTGRVTHIYPIIFNVPCVLDMQFFPMDQQNCTLTLGPWNYGSRHVNLTETTGVPTNDTYYYTLNSEWALVSMAAQRKVTKYSCCPDPFIEINYYVVLRRRWIMHFMYLFLPNIFNNCLAVLQFVLPCDSSEKIALGITLFLTNIVYLLLLNETLPISSSVPLMIIYMSATIVLVGTSLLSSILILWIHHNGNHDNHLRVPSWARTFFLKQLAKYLGMSNQITQDEDHESKLLAYQSSVVFEGIDEGTPGKAEKKEEGAQKDGQQTEQYLSSPVYQRTRQLSISVNNIKEYKDIILAKILKHCENFKEERAAKVRCEELSCEWQQLAMVINRVMTFVYLTATVCLWLYTYLSMPYYEHNNFID